MKNGYISHGRYRKRIKETELRDHLITPQISFFKEDNVAAARSTITEAIYLYFEKNESVTLTNIIIFHATINSIKELYPKEVQRVLSDMNLNIDVIDAHTHPTKALERHCLLAGSAAIRIYILMGGLITREMIIFLIWSMVCVSSLRKVAIHGPEDQIFEVMPEVSIFDSKPTMRRELFRELKKAVKKRYQPFPQLIREKKSAK
ncbi:hypothetical protein [Bdellovibrio sp. BCCA]|uniref:hypothetical protein n=1 Tax=Bdellovibrio sp. BCCA TaxID=3136281 RepID=UPI0030F1E1CE